MKHNYLQGRRFINLIRCSKDEQADTSPQDQARVSTQFGVDHGMIHAGDDVVLEGVSGSIPGARTDIDLIIDRKRRKNDFDVVVVQDFSRFTRGGLQHGNKLRWDLAAADIEVVFCTFGTTGDPDQDGLIETIGYYAAQQQAKSMSYAATRGQMSSLAAGFIPHTSKIPYGVDRLYVGLDGSKRHRIRNLADGTQQMLAVDEDRVIATYGRNPAKGASVHYKRQSDEKILLVPGAPEQVAVVREIYRRRLVEGEGTMRVARSLNDRGVPSPSGKLWQVETVESVLTNPTYAGAGITARYASGLYHVHGEQAAPKALVRDLRQIATKKSKTAKLRPREQWQWQPHPLMVDYLGDENLRELATAFQEKCFERQHRKATAPPNTKMTPGGDRHADSPYLLKGLLKSKQGGYSMTGRTTGPAHKRVRYYKINRGNKTPKTGSYLSKIVPAQPLEDAVMAIIKEILLDEANLRQAVTVALEQQRTAVEQDRQQLAPLLAEQAEVAERLTSALLMNDSSRRLLAPQISQWQARAADLEQRIAKTRATASSSAEAPLGDEAMMTLITTKMASLAQSLDTLPAEAVRTLLAALVARMEVDVETRDVEIELRLPDGVALSEATNQSSAEMCLVGPKPLQLPNEAQWLRGLKIAEIFCEGRRGVPPRVVPCFTCSRKAA